MVRNITLDKVNYLVLRKQHLTDDSRIDDIIRITRDISGLHATDSVTPYLSLFARSSNFEKDSLDEELYLKKNLGKIRCMRTFGATFDSVRADRIGGMAWPGRPVRRGRI